MNKKFFLRNRRKLLIILLVSSILLVLVAIFFEKNKLITYESNNKQFVLKYPASWQVIDLQEKSEIFTSTIHLQKNNAHFKASWGDGLGGACPEELNADIVSFDTVTVQCHFFANDTEYWAKISSKKIVNFSASAWSPVKNIKDREELIDIIKNITSIN